MSHPTPRKRSSFWKQVGKHFLSDPLELDLIPPRGSEGSFFRDGPKGGLVICGQVSITHFKQIKFGSLAITFVGEAKFQDEVSPPEYTQLIREQIVVCGKTELDPQLSGPHLEDFIFEISGEKVRGLEPSMRGKIGRTAVHIVYRLIVTVNDIDPMDQTLNKSMKIYYYRPHHYEGTRDWQGIKDRHASTRYKLKCPETGIAGALFPVSYACKQVSDTTLRRLRNSGADHMSSVNISNGTGDGRLKFQVRIVERMWVRPDERHSVPRERRVTVINEIGEETTGWLEKSNFTPRLPNWAAFSANVDEEAKIERTLRRNSIATITSLSQSFDDLDFGESVGLNPSGEFLNGKVKISHALEIILIFFDNRSVHHELPFKIIVENPFQTQRDDAFSLYSSPNGGFAAADDEQAWMLSQEEAELMANSMTAAEREYFAHILEPVPPYEGPSEEFEKSMRLQDMKQETIKEEDEIENLSITSHEKTETRNSSNSNSKYLDLPVNTTNNHEEESLNMSHSFTRQPSQISISPIFHRQPNRSSISPTFHQQPNRVSTLPTYSQQPGRTSQSQTSVRNFEKISETFQDFQHSNSLTEPFKNSGRFQTQGSSFPIYYNQFDFAANISPSSSSKYEDLLKAENSKRNGFEIYEITKQQVSQVNPFRRKDRETFEIVVPKVEEVNVSRIGDRETFEIESNQLGEPNCNRLALTKQKSDEILHSQDYLLISPSLQRSKTEIPQTSIQSIKPQTNNHHRYSTITDANLMSLKIPEKQIVKIERASMRPPAQADLNIESNSIPSYSRSKSVEGHKSYTKQLKDESNHEKSESQEFLAQPIRLRSVENLSKSFMREKEKDGIERSHTHQTSTQTTIVEQKANGDILYPFPRREPIGQRKRRVQSRLETSVDLTAQENDAELNNTFISSLNARVD
ncbi:hypothetical protein HK096_002196 [Nowakowskiella sp. JEL0078]|nr:hypothetical protein HK096_002196 [Nowakowskiella sp. JEL0078]